MKKPIPVELLEKYLHGQCSEEEAALVKQWYASFENEPGYLETLPPAELKQLEDKIYSRILENIDATSTDEPVQVTRRSTRAWYRISAAAAILVVIVTAAVIYKKNYINPQHIAGSNVEQVVAVTNNSAHIYKSVLPDGSAVWLRPNATLRFPKVFDAKARMVSMSGECFFEVTKNPKRPFIIVSNTIITKVWGTSFLVRDNGAGQAADVSVVTGKVSVSIKDSSPQNLLAINKDEVILYPQQKATYMTDAHALNLEKTINNQRLKIWQHISVNFDNKPLKDIVKVLNTTFNVSIKVTDNDINQYKLNADLSDLNLPEVLEAISKAMNIDYAIKNNTIELSKPIN